MFQKTISTRAANDIASIETSLTALPVDSSEMVVILKTPETKPIMQIETKDFQRGARISLNDFRKVRFGVLRSLTEKHFAVQKTRKRNDKGATTPITVKEVTELGSAITIKKSGPERNVAAIIARPAVCRLSLDAICNHIINEKALPAPMNILPQNRIAAGLIRKKSGNEEKRMPENSNREVMMLRKSALLSKSLFESRAIVKKAI